MTWTLFLQVSVGKCFGSLWWSSTSPPTIFKGAEDGPVQLWSWQRSRQNTLEVPSPKGRSVSLTLFSFSLNMTFTKTSMIYVFYYFLMNILSSLYWFTQFLRKYMIIIIVTERRTSIMILILLILIQTSAWWKVHRRGCWRWKMVTLICPRWRRSW